MHPLLDHKDWHCGVSDSMINCRPDQEVADLIEPCNPGNDKPAAGFLCGPDNSLWRRFVGQQNIYGCRWIRQHRAHRTHRKSGVSFRPGPRFDGVQDFQRCAPRMSQVAGTIDGAIRPRTEICCDEDRRGGTCHALSFKN
jgi:hypothetical protein